mmetsp:Transcript_2141/g.5600  ORF Transcript_2141/g.5600 Transcript_2141/m.5600 type:complete len:223 (+) Transcript_2141:75-743(+)
MQRFFGGKKPEAPKVSMADAADTASKRDELLSAKIKDLDKQLADFKNQLKTTRPGPAQARIKQRALQVLKQKRMYENQQDQVRGMAWNMEQAKFAMENMQSALHQAEAYKSTAQELKQQFKNVDISKLEDLRDDLDDLLQDVDEINEIMSRSYAVDQDIDEDELEDELNALDEELSLEAVRILTNKQTHQTYLQFIFTLVLYFACSPLIIIHCSGAPPSIET